MANVIGTAFQRQSAALQAKLLTLGPRVERKVVGAAVTRAMGPVRNEARRILRKSKVTGTLAKSIGNKTKRYQSGVVVGMVGPRRGFTIEIQPPRPDGLSPKAELRMRKHDPTKIFHLIEFGTKPHSITAGTRTNAKAIANLNDPWRSGALMVTRRTVHHPGTKRREPLGTAFRSKHAEMLKLYSERLAQGITKEAAKEGITTF